MPGVQPIQGGITVVDTDGDIADIISVNGSKGLVVACPGHVSTENSSTTPLLADASFNGEALDILNYAGIGIMVYSDVASSINGLLVEYSFNATEWHSGEAYTIPADTVKFFTPPKQAQYMRVMYTNGGSDQSTFHLHTFVSGTAFKWSSHNINSNLNDDDDGELVVSVLKLRTAQDTYVSAASTSSGNFKVSLEEYESDTNPVRSDMEGGGQISIGTTAVEMTFSGDTKSIILTADINNTGTLYIGKSNVTNTGVNALTYLLPGDTLTLSYDDGDNPIYVVGSASSQNVWKGALL